MKVEKVVPELGNKTVVYEEGFWTGKKTITVGGVVCEKREKNLFVYKDGEEVRQVIVEGSFMKGVNLRFTEGVVSVIPKTKWYEWIMSFFMVLLIIVWGNSVALCKIVPVVGGAIGGAISAVFAVCNLFVIRKVNNVLLKLLISLAFTAATFLVCFALGSALVAALS